MNKITTANPADPGADMKNTDKTEWSKFMTDDEYYPFLVKKNIRPAIWRWRDLKPRLDDVAQDPLRRADRRFIALVNLDTGEAGGVLPSIPRHPDHQSGRAHRAAPAQFLRAVSYHSGQRLLDRG